MTTEQLISLLFGAIAALLGIVWASLVYEIRRLRLAVHKQASAITALNVIVELICRKLEIPWKSQGGESE